MQSEDCFQNEVEKEEEPAKLTQKQSIEMELESKEKVSKQEKAFLDLFQRSCIGQMPHQKINLNKVSKKKIKDNFSSNNSF